MQPDFHDFGSGLRYRTTVKPSFRSVMRFYLLVSIYENTSFWRFLSFLTAGNKSYCGTLQHLTHPQQSTDSPIPEPVSSSKRQALQRKPFALSPVPTQTSSRLRTHGTSVPSTPQKLPGALIRTTSAPPMRPSHIPLNIACNSRTGVTQHHEAIRTSKMLRGNCMRNCGTPRRPLSKSHVIPPRPHSVTAQKPRNINDPISKPETFSGELRAKLLGSARGRRQGQWPPLTEATEPRLQHIRIGNEDPDSLITYPDAHNLSG